MPDAESGYYSPNETIQYLPNRDRGGGVAKAILRSGLQDVKSFCVEIRRYISNSLDRNFLVSSASRRDLWRFILPLPGLLAMLSDTGNNDLLLLDAGLSVSLFIMASLPTGWLLSDIVMCMIFAAYLPVHSVMCLVPAKLTAASPIMAAFTMASAGINSGVLVSFVALSAIAAPYVAYPWTVEQIWVVLMAIVVERRSTLLVGNERHTTEPGYKALGLAGGEEATRIPAEIISRTSAESLSPRDRVGSDGEESGPLPMDGQAGSFLGQLLNKVRGGEQETKANGPLTSIFSRLGAQTSVSSRSTQSRQRFAAEQVRPPGAAAHEAPLFEKRLDLGPDVEQPDPSAAFQPMCPSPTESQFGISSNSFLRGVKLGGFENQELNVLFVEKTDPRLVVNGRETYWPASAAFFIYRSASTNTWGVGKAKRFQQIKEGKSNGLAHSPEAYELWLDVNEIPSTPANSKKSWREWDVEGDKWVHRPGAGVLSRGKVRPKIALRSAGSEVTVQTKLTWLKDSPQEVEEQAG
eukprot:TRINITY_DN13496_c0_g1_i3.p1 TRINITY_DN13496_c0_g1~~TRINITY_DN13496_c0_g1_i3.p1  ORF type:complete len:522 (+),score=54.26 TRINITY_DN13496_c0_g1_i3:84-1649(+)